jgi:acyl carrier protein phosphodiesterase
MNFLAHIYLSGDSDELKIGNFIGDFVKASDMKHYNDDINQGIRMHWAIDEFTDHHPVVQESKERLRPKYGHYAGVIIDIFYDHFLAKNWKDYHKKDLRQYVDQQYKMLESVVELKKYHKEFEEEFQEFFPELKAYCEAFLEKN